MHNGRKVALYYVREKHWEFSQAVADCWKPDLIIPSTKELYVPGALHLITGMQFGSFATYLQVLNSGDPYIYFDKGYFNSKKPGVFDRVRATRNHFQKNWVDPCMPADRWEALGLDVAHPACSREDSHILVCPPSSMESAHIAGCNRITWTIDIVKELRKHTKRPIMLTRKGDTLTLAERFSNCHALVCVTSNMAVDALLAGIPVYCHPFAAAAPVANPLANLHTIDCPRPMHFPLESWLRSLAYGDFSRQEILNGTCKQILDQEKAL